MTMRREISLELPRGNFAQDFALDWGEDHHDECQRGKNCSRILVERAGREKLFAGLASAKGSCSGGVLQDFLPCLSVYVSLSGAALSALWGRQRHFLGHFAGRRQGYGGFRAGIWGHLSDGIG